MPDADWKWLGRLELKATSRMRMEPDKDLLACTKCIRELRAALEDTLGFYHADTSHGHCERIRALLAKWAKGGDRE